MASAPLKAGCALSVEKETHTCEDPSEYRDEESRR